MGRARIKQGGEIVDGAPKRAKSRRTLKLDPATLAALKAHRDAQRFERRKAGDDHHDEDRVFCMPGGRGFHPDGITQRFERHCRQAGLSKIRLHDVRHSYATASLRAGVPVKIVSERIGHAKASITSDIYQHAVPELDEQAADIIAAVIDGAGQDRGSNHEHQAGTL